MTYVFQFAAKPNKGVFPPELMDMICTWVAFDDLRPMACASQVLWHATCPILWKNVHRLEFMLRAIVGEKFEPPQHRIFNLVSGDVRKEVALLGATFDPNNFDSFHRIAPNVQSLSIYGSEGTDPLYLAGNLVRALEAKVVEGPPLLPRLRQLCIGPMDWTDPLELKPHRHSDAYHANLIGLFLGQGVQCLAITCKPGLIDMVKLHKLSPSIEKLHLWVDTGSEVSSSIRPNGEGTWMSWAMKRLISWSDLTVLSFNSVFLNPDTAIYLGKHLSLKRLKIKCDGTNRWGGLRFEPDCFPQLECLGLEQVTVIDMLALDNHSHLMRQLTVLELDVYKAREGERPDAQGSVIAEVCTRAPNLRHLHFHSHRPAARDFSPLVDLSLISLDLSAIFYRNDTKPLLTSLLNLHPGLEFLNVKSLEACPKFLAELAARYTKLRVLVIGFDLRRPADIDEQEPETQPDIQLSLYSYVRHARMELEEERDMIKASIIRYVERLWPNVIFHKIDPPYPSLKDYESLV